MARSTQFSVCQRPYHWLDNTDVLNQGDIETVEFVLTEPCILEVRVLPLFISARFG